ncbi:BrnA antitoxin family protein [Massilia niastensis]|uniref:BrnA antitoxin family protein n=1 Tax=Massilia niastensis TaxID=544911 RepID=UPI00035EF1D9|nr:BrnA antitoxin family protein [Massilia niastensis]
MPKLKPGTILPTPEEDAAITAAALSDPDAQPPTDAELAQFKPARGRGRPAQEITKLPTSIRLDARVVSAFKATGEGWQTRMNDALLEYARRHGMLAD